MLLAAGYFNLESLWFLLIAVLWMGYFLLEGFDFGVGMLYPFLGRDEPERRALLGTILPVWDGYEVWLLVAGGATFAAFPDWYASLFSGFYLALFLILLALIVRGVAIEYRNKHAGVVWRRRWDVALPLASGLTALLWGVAFANIVHGIPLNARGDYTGDLLDLLNVYGILGGLTVLAACALHGALFLSLRTRGELEERARRMALRLWPPTAALLIAFLVWTAVDAASTSAKQIVVLVLAGATLAAGAAAWPLAFLRRLGAAFAATSTAIVLLIATLFLWLYPEVLVSSTEGVASPTIFSAASNHYSLVAMTIVAIIFVPIVLLYQAWAFWVFRARLGREDYEQVKSPLDLLARTPLGRKSSQPEAEH
jgi:cytochrome d ubiquinol oxidase subunit II